jgi:uncharacterized SAM-binding protein YcdF (DUF218 family)
MFNKELKIYLILTGEDEKKRPRSNYLIKLIKNTNPKELKHIKIIATGKSGFNNYVHQTESDRMIKYLIKNGIPKEIIINENQAMDTLGNIIFSYEIIENLVLDLQKNNVNPIEYPKCEVNLITERFHLHRSKELFLKLFGTLKSINPAIEFKFHKNNETSFLNYFSHHKKRLLEEYAILESLILDSIHYNLQLPQQYKNYLYSLPVYKDIYKGKMNLTTSLYAKAINMLLHKREKNSLIGKDIK